MSESPKSEMTLLKEKILTQSKSTFLAKPEMFEESKDYTDGYIRFLNSCKTEREFVDESVEYLTLSGFEEFNPVYALTENAKVIYNIRGKALIAAVGGSRPLTDGIRIIAAHIDSPRLDLKPRPLYENNDIGYLKTHYYGGIKKYQWVTIPLAMHGVIITKDGRTVKLSVGENEGDTVFTITDLLPHLSRNSQDNRTAREVIKGEELNILFGSRPVEDDSVKEPVKLYLMKLLHDKYDIVEDDLVSAEIEFVPAFKAGYVGLDGSFIGGYAQDDRVCAYAALMALAGTDRSEYTTVAVFADKEETGSNGNTGLASDMLKDFVSLISKRDGVDAETVFSHSQCLSGDVSAGFDPTFPEVNEPRNAAFLNRGVSVERYTGGGGKYSTSEAPAEFVAEVRRFLDEEEIPWQANELGRIDEGGGGTVAMYIARFGVNVIDIGVPVLSMHAPYEITSRIDAYCLYKAFRKFYK